MPADQYIPARPIRGWSRAPVIAKRVREFNGRPGKTRKTSRACSPTTALKSRATRCGFVAAPESQHKASSVCGEVPEAPMQHDLTAPIHQTRNKGRLHRCLVACSHGELVCEHLVLKRAERQRLPPSYCHINQANGHFPTKTRSTMTSSRSSRHLGR